MRFFTPMECADWCQRLEVPLDGQRQPTRDLPHPHQLRFTFPSHFSQLLWLSRVIESALQPRETCLLWVTDWGIYPSNENQHLYYRLRQSYGDLRLLHEAPGHLCLDYERPEVATLIQLSILFGWDVHLIPSFAGSRAFLSHDEWGLLTFTAESQYHELRKLLDCDGIEIIENDTV